MPTMYIIAEPNGAGKTTVATTLLPEFFGVIQIVNADEIAKERVIKRVSEGGHNISADIIQRRYFKGVKNLPDFLYYPMSG